MKTKNVSISVKAGPGDGLSEGQFEAYASVFGNKDSYGDIVQPGAFKGSLERWAAKDGVIPLLFAHRMDDPDFNIGHADAVEDDHGLLIRGTLDLENPKAAQTYRMLKGRRINQMSFAYDVIDGSSVKKNGDDFFELRELELYEVSVVPIGANQATEILAVKSAADALIDGIKSGRAISAKNESELRDAHESIGRVLAALTPSDEEKASGQAEAKSTTHDEEPVTAKSPVVDEEPSVNPSAKTLIAEMQLLALSGAERGSL